jgi:deoxyribodipyrimidine photo-lyase
MQTRIQKTHFSKSLLFGESYLIISAFTKQLRQFRWFPDWAKKTLNEHRSDKRDYIYSLEEFEEANTHDKVWNFAQKQMVETGKMHSYLRMYWAKKILEWTNSPEEAIEYYIFLMTNILLMTRPKWLYGDCLEHWWSSRQAWAKELLRKNSLYERKEN